MIPILQWDSIITATITDLLASDSTFASTLISEVIPQKSYQIQNGGFVLQTIIIIGELEQQLMAVLARGLKSINSELLLLKLKMKLNFQKSLHYCRIIQTHLIQVQQ